MEMARVRLQIQGREVFETTLQVRVDDINYGGHLGNDAVLTLCQEARVRFFAELGQSELDLFGKPIVLTDAIVIYRAEARLGDRIQITLHLDDISRRGFDLYYLLSCGGREIARVKTGVAFFDPASRKAVACPVGFLQLFQRSPDSVG
jgi:4-hydroxybenzoyl-CoA thioesterase